MEKYDLLSAIGTLVASKMLEVTIAVVPFHGEDDPECIK